MLNLLGDLVVVLHFAFIVFVVFGGLLVMRWPRIAWLHLPAVVWGGVVEGFGWICPLTYLENDLLAAAGRPGYEGDFIARHLLPLIYPAALTREIQVAIGVGVVLLNAIVYAIVLVRKRKKDELHG
jgi:hypothetical protein